ncbi:MAG: NUDIX domain-containing protein [Aggregatilineales bacterium]
MTRKSQSSPSIRVNACAVIVRDGALLLIEFNDALSGLHYNLPGGGVKPGESLHDAVQREVWEEAAAKVDVGRLLLVWEYVPVQHVAKYGTRPKIAFCFRATLKPRSEPHFPDTPDADQVGIRWIPLADLASAPLIPKIADRLIKALSAPETDIPDVLYKGAL